MQPRQPFNSTSITLIILKCCAIISIQIGLAPTCLRDNTMATGIMMENIVMAQAEEELKPLAICS